MKPYGYLVTIRNTHSEYKPSYRYVVVRDLLEYAKHNITQHNEKRIENDCIVRSIPIETEEEYKEVREII